MSGIGTGLGAAFLFQAMKVGRFSLVVPLSDVAGVAIPVVIGVVLLHDQLRWWAWAGFAIAVPAIWLMTSRRGPRTGTTAGAGWWPLALNRLVAVLTVAPVAVRSERLRMSRRTALLAVASGVLGTCAIGAFLLGLSVLHERLSSRQIAGLACAAATVVLVSL